MIIKNIMSQECIDLNIKSTTKKEILEELIEMLYKKGAIDDRNKFYEDVCFREKRGSTAIGNYIAIPHGQSTHVKNFSIAIGKTTSDIEWDNIDNLSVRFIILFAVPNVEGVKDEMSIMAKICRKLADDYLCEKLLEVRSYEEIVEIFS